jgi:hypothetical protein
MRVSIGRNLSRKEEEGECGDKIVSGGQYRSNDKSSCLELFPMQCVKREGQNDIFVLGKAMKQLEDRRV